MDKLRTIDRNITGAARVAAVLKELEAAMPPIPPEWLKVAGGVESKANTLMKRVAFAPMNNLSRAEALAVDRILLSVIRNTQPVAYIQCCTSDSAVPCWRFPKHDGSKHTIAVWDIQYGRYRAAVCDGLDHIQEDYEVAEAAASLISMSRLGLKEADKTIKELKKRYNPWAMWAKDVADQADAEREQN